MKDSVSIADIPFHPVTYPQAIDQIQKMVESKGQHYVVTPNPEMIVESGKSDEFKKILQKASLSIPDGIGILWAAYYLSLPKTHGGFFAYLQLFGTLFNILIHPKEIHSVLPQRVTGSDLLRHVVDASQFYKWRIFLLGAYPGVAKKAVDQLLEDYPDAIFAGSYAGEPTDAHFETIQQRLEQAKPDIVFIAYGSPAQEKWIAEHLKKLTFVKVAIGVGGAFDFASKKVRRAPGLMQRLGLEWLFRLFLQPWRWRRIWRATGVFVAKIYRLKNNT